MKRLLIIMLAIAALASCSNGTSPETSRDPSTEPAVGTTASGSASPAGSQTPRPNRSSATPGHDDDPPGTRHASETYDRDNHPPSGFRRADSGESRTGNERLDLVVKIDPGCVETGSLVTFTAKTKPDVSVAFLTRIPSSDGRSQEEAGRSDDQGLFAWTLLVPHGIPEEQYTLFVAAADDTGTDGGISGSWWHVVAVPGACR